MKTIAKVTILISSIILIVSCKEDKPVFPPDVFTSPATNILYTYTTTGGDVANDGGAQIVEKGVCWGTSPDPDINGYNITFDGSGTGAFNSYLEGLTPGTTYYVRAYATNSQGTDYGDNITFRTPVTGIKFNPALTYGTVTDIQGKIYKTIPVGSQVWMAENLKTTQLSDGTTIPKTVDNREWIDLIIPGYSWFFDNDSIYENIYGAYYNWFAVSTGKLCPAGWHVPSDNEWQTLVNYLGGNNSAGAKIKEVGSNNWLVSNKSANNLSGLTGLPSGLRNATDGRFTGQGTYGAWWTSTESSMSEFGAAWVRGIQGDTTVVTRTEIFKKEGFSVRCIKD